MMNGQTWTIGHFKDVPIKVHRTFSIVLVFIGYLAITRDFTLRQTFVFSLLICVIFGCVILHEFGHALVAKRFGVKTRDIILMPIGGVARLESLPTEPLKEILIALAGPAVNLVIACLIYSFFLVLGIGWLQPDTDFISILDTGIGFLHLVLLINLASFAINLLPILPMDGGRILRAALSIKLDRAKASYVTRIISFLLVVIVIIAYMKTKSQI